MKGFSDGNVFNEMDVGRQFRRTSMGPVWNRIRNRVSVPVGACFPDEWISLISSRSVGFSVLAGFRRRREAEADSGPDGEVYRVAEG